MGHYRNLGITLLLTIVTTCLSVTPLRAQAGTEAKAEDPLLDTLNGEFRTQYQQALVAALAQVGPVILEEGDNLILVHNGERTSVLVKPVEYHELKAVAHIPLALFVMLSFPQEASLSPSRLENLRSYRELMEKARETLAMRHFTPEQYVRQKDIFDSSFQLLDEALAHGGVDSAKLAAFTHQLGPLLLANVADATAAEMRALYATAAAWRKSLTASEWAALHFVMIGPHMPREQECSMQFFERLFHQPEEGGRIIYAEALWNEKDALNLLATHEVDEAAGLAFFGDPMRMHRDLLADAARAYLDAHPLPQ